MRQPLPQINDTFGAWTVIGKPVWREQAGQRRACVPCQCTCGTKRVVMAQSLRRTDRGTQSCGCLKREQVSTLVSRTRWKGSHGLSKHPLYQLWKRINRRCYSPSCTQYRWYGAIGVTVWEGWRHDPAAFIRYIEQELGPRPSPKHSLDRYPPDANYEPGKLRWADPLMQAQNRRNSRERVAT